MVRSALIALSLVATACGGNGTSASSAATPTSETPRATVTSLEVTTDACDSYLDFLAAQDGLSLDEASAELLDSVEDPDLESAILALRAGTGPLTEVRAASDLLSAQLVPACEETYSSDVSPTATDEQAAEVLLESLKSGNRNRASTVAWANVIAQFEPWEPQPESGSSFGIEVDLLTFEFGEGIVVDCLLGQGQIILCEFE